MNKITSSCSLLLISLIIIVSGCAPAYIPNVINAPLLNNKNEFQGAINVGASGFDPQFSYALTDHIGLMMNGCFSNSDPSIKSSSYNKHQFYEFGAGYFTRDKNNLLFEVYGGAGFGTFNSKYSYNLWTDHVDLKTRRLFLQPTVGITLKFVDLSFSTRLVHLNLEQGNLYLNTFFYEPAFTFKVGPKYLKYIIQISGSDPIAKSNTGLSRIMMSMGLQFNFGKKDNLAPANKH